MLAPHIKKAPILLGMSPAYEHLSSIGTPLSIFALTNDYLMSGHREARIVRRIPLFDRDSREKWGKQVFEVRSSRLSKIRTLNFELRVAHVWLVSLTIHERRSQSMS